MNHPQTIAGRRVLAAARCASLLVRAGIALVLCWSMAGLASAEPPSDVELFQTIRRIQVEYTELEVEDFGRSKREFPGITRDALSQLELDQLTPYQTVLLAPFMRRETGAEQMAAYERSLQHAAEGDDVNAAIALCYLNNIHFDPSGTVYLERLLSHPGLDPAINTWFCNDIINSLGSVEPRFVLAHLPGIEQAILALRPAAIVRPLNRPSLARLFERLDDEAIAPETADARRRIHEHLLKVARATLAKFAPAYASYGSERYWIDRAVDVVEYLEGPGARGAVEGAEAPAIDFLWFRGPDAPVRTLANLRGKVVVLDFWATWCGPCIASFPDVQKLQEHYAAKDVVIIGVTAVQGFHVPGDGAPRVMLENEPEREFELMAQFMQEKGVTWNVGFSTRGVTDPRYEVWGIPHLTIIDSAGTVRHNGPSGAISSEAVMGIIDALLEEQDPT